MKVGERLRTLRQERGLTQEELAARSGLSRVTISALERDENEPSGGTIEKLVAGLDLSTVAALVDIANGDSNQSGTPISKDEAQKSLGLMALPLFNTPPLDLQWNVDSTECEGEFYVLRHFIRRAGYVVLKIHGAAMWPTYLDGDLVLVDATRRNAHSRDVVVASYSGNTGVFRFRREGRHTYLRPDDPLSRPIEIINRDDLVIGGVVIALVWREGSKTVT